jgi:3'-phosphoadenosine 5'-phosphosulfate sulfotransferase (PAPS reductase)/FAD synthetase
MLGVEVNDIMNEQLLQKVDDAKNILHKYCESDKKVACLFSGGKDSCVMYYLLKELGLISRVYFLYNGSGMETDEFSKFIKTNYPLVDWVISPENKPLDEIWKENRRLPNLSPTPVEYKSLTHFPQYNDDNKYQMYCCYKIRYKAKWDILRHYDYIIAGFKNTDPTNRYLVNGGVTTTMYKKLYINPLYAWTDDDCWDLIHECSIPVSSDYELFKGTYTCPLCCVYTKHRSDLNLNILKTHYPDLLKRYQDVAKYCYDNNAYLQSKYKDWEEYFYVWLNKDVYRQRCADGTL